MDYLEFLDKNFVPLITLISAIGGAYIGGVITYFSQKSVISRQIEWDKTKEMRANKIEKLDVYSEILETNGVSGVIDYNGGRKVEVDLEIYEKDIRPILYKKLYYLDEDVAQFVKEMDDEIGYYKFHEGAEEWQIERTAKAYLEFITKVEFHLENFRSESNERN